jgi:uncharacterized membrane protein
MDSNFIADLDAKLVHFPVALLSIYALLEIVGIMFKKEFVTKSALLILCLGVIFAFFAVLTGNEAFSVFQFWTKESSEVLNEHQTYATFLLWFSFFVCALRIFLVVKNKFSGLKKIIFILFTVIILYLVYETAEHGGKLVSKFGIGTEIILQRDSLP